MSMKPINFSAWKKLIKYSFNDFNKWVIEFYKSAYLDGIEYVEEKTKEDCFTSITEERLLEILLSVKGIGRIRAQKVVDMILEEPEEDGYETR